MGLFAFSVSLSTAVMLVFNSISWIIYPRLISRLSDVKLGKKGQHRLVVHFKDDSDQMAEIEILTCLAKAKVTYREMIRGERLQESVTDQLDTDN